MNRHSESAAKLRDRFREVVRDEILGAAEEEFARAGLHKARMETIATRAGVAVGTLYNHFKDRDALLTALLDDRRTQMFSRLDAAIAAEVRNGFRAQLQAFFTALLEHFDAHRPFLSILLQNEQLGCAGKVASFGAPSRAMQEVYARAEALVKKGLGEKALRREGAELFPVYLVGIVRAVLVLDLLREPSSQGVTRHVNALMDFFLQGAIRS